MRAAFNGFAKSVANEPWLILWMRYAGSNGLPLAEHQPSWLLKQDVLVVDARGQEHLRFDS